MSLTTHQLKTIGENAFEEKIKSYGRKGYCARFPDTSDIRARMKKLGQQSYAFLDSNPSDYIVTLYNKMFYAEVKTVSGSSLKFSRFERGQLAAMKQQEAAGGEYFIFCYIISEKDWAIVPGHIILKMLADDQTSINLTQSHRGIYYGSPGWNIFIDR